MSGHDAELIGEVASVISETSTQDLEPKDRAVRVLDSVQEWVERQDSAAQDYADQCMERTGFKGMNVETGSVDVHLIPPHDLVASMAKSLAEFLRTAENYAETPFSLVLGAPDGGPPDDAPSVSMEVHAAGDPEGFVVTVQRKWKKTPHQLRREAEAERDRLRAELEELRADGGML